MNESNDTLVGLRGVTKAYETPAGPFLALRGVDLTVGPGEFVAVIGKSGSGKSTLINAIAGIDRPTDGEVTVTGTRVDQLSEDQIARWRGDHLGVIFQFFQLLPTLTLLENVMLPMEFARRGSAAQRRARALALLERVEMADHADKLPSAVSGGQQQRVAIARALANDPVLIVADEPTGSLDARTADTIFQLFEELVDQGKTILMVTHDNDLAARASRVVLISDGEVVESHVRRALGDLSDAQLGEVSAHLEPVVLDAGAEVFAEGATADRFYIVVRGTVEIRRAGDLVAELGPGQHFGEIGLLTGEPRNATAVVATGTEASLVALGAADFRRLAAEGHLDQDAIARVMRERLSAHTLREVMPDPVVATVDALSEEGRHESFEPGATILRPGDPADRFYVVLDGMVEVMSASGDTVAYRYRAGRHFGTRGLAPDGRSVALLRASPASDGPTVIASVPGSVARDVVAGDGPSEAHLARLLTGAMRRPGSASL